MSSASASIYENIYVADVQNSCIQKFNAEEKFLYKFGGQEGTEAGQFNNPRPSPRIMSAIFGSRTPGTTGCKNSPKKANSFPPWEVPESGRAVHRALWRGRGQGQQRLRGQYGNRIQKFTSEGKFILKFGKEETATGSSTIRPAFLWTRKHGVFTISDLGNTVSEKFDGNGKFLMKFGKKDQARQIKQSTGHLLRQSGQYFRGGSGEPPD